MSYSDFTLNRVARDFNLTISERSGIFTEIPELTPSDFIQETLRDHMALALASHTEKARSELIIAIDLLEYFVKDLGKILGILASSIN